MPTEPSVRRSAVEEAMILARALMSFTARSMNYLVASSVACSQIQQPVGAWFKLHGDYGDWYIRLERDGNNFRGASRPTAPPDKSDIVVDVPTGATPVTDAVRSFLEGFRERPASVFDAPGMVVVAPALLGGAPANEVETLSRTIAAWDPGHRAPLVSELLALYKSTEREPLVEQLRAFQAWIESEHRAYATDALVPALVALMVSALEQVNDASLAERVKAFMQPEMFTSVGLVRDRFLAAPPFRAEPSVLIGAAAALMTSVDEAVAAARASSTVEEMCRLLYERLPMCIAARWIFDWCTHAPLAEVTRSAQAQSTRAEETLVRMRAAFLHQVLDLAGHEA